MADAIPVDVLFYDRIQYVVERLDDPAHEQHYRASALIGKRDALEAWGDTPNDALRDLFIGVSAVLRVEERDRENPEDP